MNHPRLLKIEDYTYHLPANKIAHFPKEERDAAKLLVYEEGLLQEDIYRNIDEYLPADSLMVFNQTKVVQVRLHFKKSTGGQLEIFCLEPDTRYADMQTAMMQHSEVYWQCLVGGAQKWKNDSAIFLEIVELGVIIEARIVEKKDGYFIIHFKWGAAHISFAELLHYAGKVPLPPYMQRETQEQDKERYQTIYAREEGSVAAPTAGLHFTDTIFKKLQSKHIHSAFLTLHVGAGTFKQVKSETIGAHEMHSEWIEIELDFLKKLKSYLGKIIAVGTTSMRTLESIYWLGLKLHHKVPINWQGDAVGQWDAYDLIADIDPSRAIDCLVEWMENNQKVKLITRTQILIAPSYKPKIVASLVTNFHQPDSTLLLLVAALIGDDWRMLYNYALQYDFRFLSYGDGCLLHYKKA